MVTAFKEWANIVDAIGTGRQNIILRKGGIIEDEGEFSLKAKKFLLFPTQFHQTKDQIKPAWQPFLNGERFLVDENQIYLKYFVEVADAKLVKDWNNLKRLQNYHAWTEEVIKEKFIRWEESLYLLVVQAYQLSNPVKVTIKPEYAGCKSWIELEEEIELVGKPVLNPSIH